MLSAVNSPSVNCKVCSLLSNGMAFCTVSPLLRNLQVASFQRSKRVFTCPVMCQFMCLAYIVTCVHPLQIDVVLYCVYLCVLYSTVQSITVQYLHFFAFSLEGSSCMPAVVLYYCTFQGTVPIDYKWFLYFLWGFFYVLFV